jgi:hypothetical protein
MSAERDLGLDWLSIFAGVEDAPRRLAIALGMTYPPAEAELAALAVAGDLGLAAADIVLLDTVGDSTLARQWRLADCGERSLPAIILPVSTDGARPFYDPGELTLSMAALGAKLFTDCICDLVAIPLDGTRPLSFTGQTLAVGRFAVRERGELRIFASGISWLREHLERARTLGAELPARLVAHQLDPPDHFSTLLLQPSAIEWRPQIAWCPLPPETKQLVVVDSMGLAHLIDGLMRRKEKLPPMPTVMGPRNAA